MPRTQEPGRSWLLRPVMLGALLLAAGPRSEIAQLTNESGVTTVHVTHDQAEVMSLGDRVAVTNPGG
ncbi:hypothetical protein OG953_33595 [Streptomyces sp. NBC_00057]